MNKAHFRYSLEPVLVMRRWALDTLLRTLAEHNARIGVLAVDAAALQARYAAASIAWQGATGAQTVQHFAMNARYMGDLTCQLRENAACMKTLAAARDGVVASAVAAKRALEAAEQHRGQMKGQFVRLRMSADFRLADDQWNTQHTGAASHGY